MNSIILTIISKEHPAFKETAETFMATFKTPRRYSARKNKFYLYFLVECQWPSDFDLRALV
jgi:hypothetical protein